MRAVFTGGSLKLPADGRGPREGEREAEQNLRLCTAGPARGAHGNECASKPADGGGRLKRDAVEALAVPWIGAGYIQTEVDFAKAGRRKDVPVANDAIHRRCERQRRVMIRPI